MRKSNFLFREKKVLVILALSFFVFLIVYFILGSIDAPEQSYAELRPRPQKVLKDEENLCQN